MPELLGDQERAMADADSGLQPLRMWQTIRPGLQVGDVCEAGLQQTGGQRLSPRGWLCASAPLWGSLITRINASLGARVGNFNALLYQKIGPAKVLREYETMLREPNIFRSLLLVRATASGRVVGDHP